MYVLYLFAGFVDSELLACTYDNGGEKGCATFKDTPSCGISTGIVTVKKQKGDSTTISAKIAAAASGKLKGIGISVGAEASGSHTVTTEEILEQKIGTQNLIGLTGKICLRNRITKFTMRKWEKEFACRKCGRKGRHPDSTHYRWIPTAETEDHQVITGFCKEDLTSPCTTKSPTVSSLYLIYLL